MMQKKVAKFESIKILIVDDDDLTLTIIGDILSSEGYEVRACQSGREALQIIADFSPAIVLTDLQMPEMDGLELLHEIKKVNPDIQVIILTAHGDMQSAVSGFRDGAVDFLTKSPSDKELKEAIKRAIERYMLNIAEKGHDHLRDIVKGALEAADAEKKKALDDMQRRINKIIYPQIEMMESKTDDKDVKEGLKFIRELLDSLFSPSSSIVSEYSRLSPTEIKICTMPIQGKNSQEIADALNRSLDTIYDHQKKIRSQLGLTKTRQSLAGFLRAGDFVKKGGEKTDSPKDH